MNIIIRNEIESDIALRGSDSLNLAKPGISLPPDSSIEYLR